MEASVMTTAKRPRCILPGCTNPSSEQGLPCDECLATCSDFLRMGAGPAMTAEQQAARDDAIRHRYMLQRECAARSIAPEDMSRPIAAPRPAEPERKRNQRCWLCEERHTCTKCERGWECDNCRAVA